ncbi:MULTISPECIES: hypothetical protein [Streptomyces]|uniref:hypothetical protein n=1 Tax=Streptomyces TaxID=1883 RepID=UPI001E640420|nr:hypothetical protein [Streptomyces ruber]
MTITPVTLALISTGAGLLGAVIGALATLMSAHLTQRATRDREGAFKIWERRADAIEEAHRRMYALSRTRDSAFLRRAVSSADYHELVLDPNNEANRLVITKLVLYTTPELVQAFRESNIAVRNALSAIQYLQLALAEDDGEARERDGRQWDIEAATPAAVRAVEESKAADERFTAALREAATLTARRGRRG